MAFAAVPGMLTCMDEQDAGTARTAVLPSHPGWEEVRAVHAELLELAERVADHEVRDRLRAASRRLAAAGTPPPRRPHRPR
ncbi:hypothetical protein DZF91_03085, partial [Actinomadura logoneensis]